jgi:serine/threonine-protein kinase
MFELQDELASQVAFFLREMLGEEVALIERQEGAEDVEAWEMLQRARAQSDLAAGLADAGDETAWDRMAVADSLLAAAEELAPEWVEPTVRRGWLAYQRSRWAGVMEQGDVLPWIEAGLERAEIALRLEPENPDALELRGTLKYWQWIMDLAPGVDAANELFDGAEADLMQAAIENPGQAGAWAALSHLLLNKDQTAEGKLAATRAYEADAYLRNADVILWRLFSTSYDLQDQVDANHWCAELGRRFPGDDRFAECRLWRMTMHNAALDVDSAWVYAEEVVQLRSPQTREFDRRWAGMAVAAVLARAGMADSARAVADRSHGDATVDPIRDLAYAEAFVRTLLGEYDAAIDLLAEYMAVSGRDPADLDFWWFDDLREEPRYRMLVGPMGE